MFGNKACKQIYEGIAENLGALLNHKHGTNVVEKGIVFADQKHLIMIA